MSVGLQAKNSVCKSTAKSADSVKTVYAEQQKAEHIAVEV